MSVTAAFAQVIVQALQLCICNIDSIAAAARPSAVRLLNDSIKYTAKFKIYN